MRELYQSRIASALAVLLGAWLLLSPLWISISGGALVSLLIVGAVMVVSGLVQMFTDNNLPSWVIGLAAVWLFISAFAFSVSNAVMWNEILSAIAAFILASWDGVETSEVQRRHHAGAS